MGYAMMVRGKGCIKLLVILMVVATTCENVRGQRGAKSPSAHQLETKDGVLLNVKYYPSKMNENAVPVILLHPWKGQGSELSALASHLNSAAGGNHAVCVPDLRAHGLSTNRVADVAGKPLKAEKFTGRDIQDVVRFDMEAIKKFLLIEHNQKKLNIDMLTLVGAEMGGVVALYWTMTDWEWPRLAGRRQGQDVKAVVLISPPTGFRGLKSQTPIAHAAFREDVSVQVVVGKKGSKPFSAARRLYAALNRTRSNDYGLQLLELDTSLQGTSLFDEKQLKVAESVSKFIESEIVAFASEFKWEPRGNEVQAASDDSPE